MSRRSVGTGLKGFDWEFVVSWVYVLKPYKTWMFWMSLQGRTCGVSQEVHPTSCEFPIESFKTSANRTPRHGYLPPETRCKPIHGALGRRHPCRLTVSGGRYPYPGLGEWILTGGLTAAFHKKGRHFSMTAS